MPDTSILAVFELYAGPAAVIRSIAVLAHKPDAFRHCNLRHDVRSIDENFEPFLELLRIRDRQLNLTPPINSIGGSIRESYMNESFSLQFKRDKRILPITRFSMRESIAWPPGITIDGEWSAWPLGMALKLSPRNKDTKAAIKAVRVEQNWRPNEFDLQVTSRTNRLDFCGVAPKALPAGRL